MDNNNNRIPVATTVDAQGGVRPMPKFTMPRGFETSLPSTPGVSQNDGSVFPSPLSIGGGVSPHNTATMSYAPSGMFVHAQPGGQHMVMPMGGPMLVPAGHAGSFSPALWGAHPGTPPNSGTPIPTFTTLPLTSQQLLILQQQGQQFIVSPFVPQMQPQMHMPQDNAQFHRQVSAPSHRQPRPSPVAATVTGNVGRSISLQDRKTKSNAPKGPRPLGKSDSAEPASPKSSGTPCSPKLPESTADVPGGNESDAGDLPLDATFVSTIGGGDGTVTQAMLQFTHEDVSELQQVAASTESASEALIDDLRRESTDRAVRHRILRLSFPTCVGIHNILCSRTDLILDLCLKERGNVVCTVLEKLGGDSCASLIKVVEDNFLLLALNQSGCIALPRVLSWTTPQQLAVFCDLVVAHFETLATHPFGNYIIAHMVTSKGTESCLINMAKRLVAPQNLATIASTKFGSHVVEQFLRKCQLPEVHLLVLEAVFSNMDVLRLLCTDGFANYVVQAAFAVLVTLPTTVPTNVFVEIAKSPEVTTKLLFALWCFQRAALACENSMYKQNILKHAVASVRDGPPGAPMPGSPQSPQNSPQLSRKGSSGVRQSSKTHMRQQSSPQNHTLSPLNSTHSLSNSSSMSPRH